MSAALVPTRTDLKLWERFQSGHCSDQEIESSVVLRRWMRCRSAGLLGENSGDPVMALAGLSESIDSFAPVLAAGAPFDAFATTMAVAGFCGIFSDADGVILARRIAEPFQTAAARTSLVEGAVWSEAARGTNGIGTTLEERAPIAIVGVEHYERRNHGLACYAAPVRDVRERMVAVLDATGPISTAAKFVHASVAATAAAIEALIIGRTYDVAMPGGLFELERLLERLPHPTLLIESTGRIRRVNERFRALVPTIDLSRALCHELLAEPEAASARLRERVPALRTTSVEIEPIGKAGDPFASLVHLRPRHERPRTVVPVARPSPAFAAIVGRDPAITAARGQAARFAPTDVPVLLLSETGAGKEIFARAIHAASKREKAPFIAVNCGALTGTLLESELFGYGPGAFTGAASTGRTGKLAAADGGTLFLDEVGETSPAAQAMLLRFLEDGTFYRVGEATERRADVRLIAATSRDLPAFVSEGRFRSDLYFRMRGVVLRLPALRHRTDRHELALALLDRVATAHESPKPLGISRAAFEWIDRHEWPGNVRELKIALEYAVVLAGDAPRIELWHLPVDETARTSDSGDLRASAERTALLQALDRSRGNLSDAARCLGVARSTLYRMLARHDLRPDASSLSD